MPGQAPIVKFGIFEFDLQSGELRKAGMRQKLAGQPLQILQSLLERPQEIVTREQLRQRLWPNNTFVDHELALKKSVNRLREVLGDPAENPRFIETTPRLGYRFIGSLVAPKPVEAAQTINVVPARRKIPGTLDAPQQETMLCRCAKFRSRAAPTKKQTVERAASKKKRERERSLFATEQYGWAIYLPGNICGNDHGFLLLVVLGEPDFRAASGQFAARETTCDPNLPEKIVAAHSVEDELGVCGGCDTFASV
jgi:DNA-binding winged helix-turn-helix (wHTH) protein